MLYLGWYDDSPKKDVYTKIQEGLQAYFERFGVKASTVILNPDEMQSIEVAKVPVNVRSESYIRRNNYWIGV